MSDINIDTADRQNLEQVADDMGVKYQSNTGDDTLRKRIKEKLGDTGSADTQEAAPKKPKGKRYEIIVATDNQDKQPVFVGVNGRNYVIQRGKKVTVPAAVVNVLSTAVQDVYDPESMEKHPVQSYPFQIIREVE